MPEKNSEGKKYTNFYRTNGVSDIINIVKSISNINYEKLVVKAQVNPPYLKESTVKELIRLLIIDDQLKINEKGEVTLCHI